MYNTGNLILLIISLAASIGLSLTYPIIGVPVLILLVYVIVNNTEK
jgi:hypothetical protein